MVKYILSNYIILMFMWTFQLCVLLTVTPWFIT